jgi:hypothetical protein
LKELNKGPLSQPRFIRDGLMPLVNPVRNSSGALNLAGIILKSNPAAEHWGIISNGVKSFGNFK